VTRRRRRCSRGRGNDKKRPRCGGYSDGVVVALAGRRRLVVRVRRVQNKIIIIIMYKRNGRVHCTGIVCPKNAIDIRY